MEIDQLMLLPLAIVMAAFILRLYTIILLYDYYTPKQKKNYVW